MVDNNKIEVYNKSAGLVMYKIPNSASGGVRTFYANQKQMIPIQEFI